MRDGCPFCDYDGPSMVFHEGSILTGNDVVGIAAFPYFVIEPLNPATPGHMLVIPRQHIADFREYPRLLGALMQAAGDLAAALTTPLFAPIREIGMGEFWKDVPGCNLIVSAGREASQTVNHLHVHVIPRREGDGLRLPWSA